MIPSRAPATGCARPALARAICGRCLTGSFAGPFSRSTNMTSANSDDAARRAYWTEQLELGYEVVQKLIAFPVEECGERFASLTEAAADAKVEMLFSTSKIAGDLDRIFVMRETLVRDVMTIA